MKWGATKLAAPVERGQPKRLYADATPAQVAAVLAGLAAQPNVFLAVNVSGDSSAYGGVHDWKFAEQPRDKAKADSSSSGVMTLRAKASSDATAKNAKARGSAIGAGRAPGRESFEFEQRVRVAGPTDQQGAVGQLDVSVKEGVQQQSLAVPSASIQADELRMADQPAQIEPASQAMPRRPVLFVLHIVDAPPPAAAAEPAKASKPDK